MGSAISSPSFGSLRNYFGNIIHTVPPFHADAGSQNELVQCYLESFKIAWSQDKFQKQIKINNDIPVSVASVVLGAGCRVRTLFCTKFMNKAVLSKTPIIYAYVLMHMLQGIPFEEAAKSAAKACQTFDLNHRNCIKRRTVQSEISPDTPRCRDHVDNSKLLHFVLREEEHMHILGECLEKYGDVQ